MSAGGALAAHALREVIAHRLGLDPDGHGTSAAVARELGLSRQQLGDALYGRASLGLAWKWAAKVGVHITLMPDVVRVHDPETGRSVTVDRDGSVEAV